MKNILIIGGSDCSGGAGIQADIRTATLNGVYCSTAISAITIQNSCGVSGVFPVSADHLRAQLNAISYDIAPDAIKIGLLCNPEQIRIVKEYILRLKRPKNIVLDPIIRPTKGSFSCNEENSEMRRLYHDLCWRCSLITPNLSEAEWLLNSSSDKIEDIQMLGRRLASMITPSKVLITGGDCEGSKAQDILYPGGMTFQLPRINTVNTHGSGCVFSTSIACNLSKGMDLINSIKDAKSFLHKALERGKDFQSKDCYGPALNNF